MENNWKAGDVAKCIKVGKMNESTNGTPPPLRLNSEYIVQAVKSCECGNVQLDVGLASAASDTKGTICNCGATARPGTGIHWANASRFVKKQTAVETEEQVEYASIDDAVKAEDYVAAAKMRDNLKT